tara:strand:+ start:327 stop:755 length:429 start_codon:yes stop_codon:yes gene_type:complete
MKIKIVSIGKVKEKLYRKRIEEYIKWISKYSKIDIIELKDSNSERLDKNLYKYLESDYYTICVSEKGEQKTSEQFSKFLYKQNNRLIFFIGGPNGHPEFVQNLSNKVLSFSKMTLIHEMSLLILCEQIFRGITIKEGRKYHK